MDFHEYSSLFPMMDSDSFEKLKNDIKENGLLTSIYLYEGKILDGRNRFKACEAVGVEPRFEKYGGSDPVGFIISLNLARRNLTKDQLAVIAVEALPLFEAEAKKRQGTRTDLKLNLPQKVAEGEARELVGRCFNVNKTYVSKAKKLKRNNSEYFEKVKCGKLNFSQIRTEEMKQKKVEQTEKIKALVLPEGKFNLIVVDPPWEQAGEYSSTNFRGGTKYPAMTTQQIKDYPILERADNDCVLWLWGIDAGLKETLEVIESWGFKRKDTLIWHKTGAMGLGKWLRREHEYCFLCVKGKPQFKGESFRSVFDAPRRKSCEKPDEFYDLIIKASPDLKFRLDVFARKKRVGWVSIGDEVE